VSYYLFPKGYTTVLRLNLDSVYVQVKTLEKKFKEWENNVDDEYGMKTPKLRKTNNNKKEEVSLENEKDMDTSGLYVVVDRITSGRIE
jgi:hypothetical protein